ncbi:hypothetical protein [Taibaiella koreensis]|uniref:hypothetical protein n=1 Tax=Taibaiella koreensis TaxID=1268548 RepID=UPI0013C2EA4C|nr:hypothetical protein [Taibaiella koreensis]
MRYFILLIFVMLSCNSGVDDFYKTSHTEDIDVLPLIKPYRLWTPIANWPAWALDFKKPVSVDTDLHVSQMQVCEINVSNGIIYGHCAHQSSAMNNSYFVIVPDSNVEKIFGSREAWDTYLSARNANSDVLYDVNEVYTRFNEKGYKELPWNAGIKQ